MDAKPEAHPHLLALINGYKVSKAISVVASLGIADLLAAGPRGVAELATATGSHPGSLYRLLRMVAAAGVLSEDGDRTFALTELGQLLRSDVPGSLVGYATFVGRPYHLEAWAGLDHSVATGENAFVAVHGERVWEWRAHEPAESAIFDRAMLSLTGGLADRVAESYDFGGSASVVDVGGGTGVLLAAILRRYPSVRGVLFDQPHVVSAASEVLERAGVGDRCDIVSGDFFERVPGGADAYLMKSILHDWEDDEAARIVRTIRSASSPASRLLVVERIVGPPNEGLQSKIYDLQMLVGPGGRERTIGEWQDLYRAGGYVVSDIRPIDEEWHLIVGTPA
jgi:hypothetical protein